MTTRERRIRYLQREVLRFETMERAAREAKQKCLAELRELGGKRIARRSVNEKLSPCAKGIWKQP